MVFLIKATLAGSLVLAAATTPVPSFDVDPSCRAAAQRATSPDSLSICRTTEQKAHDTVASQWPQFSPADKTECVPMVSLGGEPTYTELLTCLELTHQARELRRKDPPTTTGAGATLIQP